MKTLTVFRVRGIVQGVGFRPYIYRKCKELKIKGYIKNSSDGVEIAIGKPEMIGDILSSIPPFAKISSVEKMGTTTTEKDGFHIIRSDSESSVISIPPDTATCKKCENELRNPDNRRNGYFFITCTDCGPRFSAIKKMPYDRKNTSMNEFEMCEKCKKEYNDPMSRRFHAQTIACSDCGPRLFYMENGKSKSFDNAINDILSGEIVSIKGIGGFHIACIPKEETINRLRETTARKRKPFAMMAKDISMIRRFCHVNEQEKMLLESPARPIIALRKKNPNEMNHVSELNTLGFMLPYTPLHHLIFDRIDTPLIMTSSNISNEPITIDDKTQITERILTHNLRIINRIDDSVVKVVKNKPLLIRRSRGFVPLPIEVDIDSDKTILSLGAEMNNTITVLKDKKAYMSQFLGNISNHKTLENMKISVFRFLDFLGTAPDEIICDLHPSYNSSAVGRELSEKFNVPLRKVQHHRAHANSVLLENGLEKALSVVCDGTGYGDDGNIWGGEIFLGEKRVASLEEHIMPGGEYAIRQPWRMLGGILSSFLSDTELENEMKPFISGNDFHVFNRQIAEKFNANITTSCGRVLDAASVFLGLCKEMDYDGRPAMLLESFVKEKPYDIEPVIQRKERYILKTSPLFEFLVEHKNDDKGRLAATVHQYLAQGLSSISDKINTDLPRTFSGGVAYNRYITSYLMENNFIVNEKVPCGDGGISLGQLKT